MTKKAVAFLALKLGGAIIGFFAGLVSLVFEVTRTSTELCETVINPHVCGEVGMGGVAVLLTLGTMFIILACGFHISSAMKVLEGDKL